MINHGGSVLISGSITDEFMAEYVVRKQDLFGTGVSFGGYVTLPSSLLLSLLPDLYGVSFFPLPSLSTILFLS